MTFFIQTFVKCLIVVSLLPLNAFAQGGESARRLEEASRFSKALRMQSDDNKKLSEDLAGFEDFQFEALRKTVGASILAWTIYLGVRGGMRLMYTRSLPSLGPEGVIGNFFNNYYNGAMITAPMGFLFGGAVGMVLIPRPNEAEVKSLESRYEERQRKQMAELEKADLLLRSDDLAAAVFIKLSKPQRQEYIHRLEGALESLPKLYKANRDEIQKAMSHDMDVKDPQNRSYFRRIFSVGADQIEYKQMAATYLRLQHLLAESFHEANDQLTEEYKAALSLD